MSDNTQYIQANQVAFAKMTAPCITFFGKITIKEDLSIELAEGVSVDEASKIFWNYVAYCRGAQPLFPEVDHIS